ncbi:MAG: stress response translation initiation inhibitor YciH [Candidatus Woesearchaeota archaeon]
MEIDPITGLPKALGSFQEISKESQQIKISTIKKKFGKKYTVIEGLTEKESGKELAKTLKNKFACGGTYKDGLIELQGDYTSKIKDVLANLGYDVENIYIKA